jgi:gliding motility-associated-like protein
MRSIFIFCFLFSIVNVETLVAQEHEHAHKKEYAFLENKGQWHTGVLFKSQFEAGNLWVQQNKMVFHIQDFSALEKAHLAKTNVANIHMKQLVLHQNFIGSNKVTDIQKTKSSPHYYNFFLGNDSKKWASEVYSYEEAVLKNYYNNIDLKLIEHETKLKYEFIVKENTDPSVIQWNYAGNDELKITNNGELHVKTSLGTIIEKAPEAFQIIAGKIIPVKCAFQIKNNIISFKIGEYRKDIQLVIDPILVFATYCGSPSDNFGMSATYGYDATAFSGGTVYGNGYPTPDNAAYDVASNFTVLNVGNSITTDAFISHYSANGQTMIWTTFLGGGNNTQGTETVHSLICDKQNNIFVYGATSSTDFPIVGGFQSSHGGGTSLQVAFNGSNFGTQGTDIYIAKISANGHNLLGSTYMGGSQNDGVNYKVSSGSYNSVTAYDSLTSNYGDQFRGEIMLDQNNNVLIASCTRSQNFPVLNAFQSLNAGQQDGVVFKLSNNLNSLVWSSYFGGANNDACYSIKVDSSYNIVFAGGTSSSNLPNTIGGINPVYLGGISDGFVAKLPSSGLTILQSSYIGSANYDQTMFVEIDRDDNVYLLGQSRGGTFPVVNALYSNPNSAQYILKLNPLLNNVLNSTVFGNGNTQINISPSAFLVDICGNIYVSGWGANILQSIPLSGMPVTANAFQANAPNGFDFFLFVLARDFDTQLYGSYIGGSAAQEHVDGGTSRFDKNGVVYQSVCGGCGGNSDFPTSPNAWSAQNLSTNCNNLLFKFDFQIIPNAQFTVGDVTGCAPFSVTFNNTSTTNDTYLWDFGNGDTTSLIFNPTIIFDTAGVYFVNLYVTDAVCLLVDTAKITINVSNSVEVEAGSDQFLCSSNPATLTANSNGTSDQFQWSTSLTFSPLLNANPFDNVIIVDPPNTTVYYVRVGDSICNAIDSVKIIVAEDGLVISGNDTICLGSSSLLSAASLSNFPITSYEWKPIAAFSGATNNSTANLQISASQFVSCKIVLSNGCILEDSIFVFVNTINPTLYTASASEYYVPEGTTVDLFATPNGFQYEWSPIIGLSDPSVQNPTALVKETTEYIVTIKDPTCAVQRSVKIVTFPFVCGNPYFFIPNAFTPNGDGNNDELTVRGLIVKELLFRVFDRWGEMVFETKQREGAWDGTFKGKKLDPDVYDYYLKVICIDNVESIVKGNVTLIR